MHKTSAAFRAIAALALVLALVAGLFSPRGISAQSDEALPSGEPEITTPVEPTDEATVEVPTEPVATEPVATEPVATEPVATEPVATEPVVTTEPEVVVPDAVDGPAGEDSGTDVDGDGDSGDTFEIAQEALELRARVQDDNDGGVGDTVFVITSGAENTADGDSAPLSGATFQIVTNADNTVIDEVTTGATGLVFLDIPLGVGFRVIDTSTNDQSETINLSRGDVQQGRPVVTATRLVEVGEVEVPSEGPTGDEILTPLAVDQIELRARVQEVSGGESGTTIIFSEGGLELPIGDVGTDQIDDSRPEAGLTFRVLLINGDVIDQGTTGPDGILLLDAPLLLPFFIQDTETLDISDIFILDEETVQEGRTLATATRFIAVVPGQNEGPTGDILPFAIAEDQLELRARFQQNPERDGDTLYVQGAPDGGGVEDADFANGESFPAAGVTFTVLSEDNLVIDQATTDADGFVLLDLPVQNDEEGTDTYTLLDSFNNDPETFDAPFPDEFLGGGDSTVEGRDLTTATLFTDDLDDVAPSDIAIPSASASASASASNGGPSNIGIPSNPASASASASASPSPSIPVNVDAVVITGQISENDDRAGEYDYFYNFVEADDEGDVRFAGAGEQTYTVAYFDGGDVVIVDSGATDANGMVTLNAPVGFDYFIYEDDDFNDPYGSQDVPADTSANFLVIEYVTDITASPSATASGAASGSAHPSGSDDDDDNGSAASSAAAAASSAGTGGATALPNTGAGDSGTGSSMTWALFALLAVVGVVAAGFGLRRRTV